MEAKSTLVKIALVAQLVLLLSVGTASAHYLTSDSVSESGEIRWEERTRYDDARRFSVSQWNRLGRVPIQPDSRGTATDLVFRDYRQCGSGVVALWQPSDGADSINFNVCHMNNQSSSNKRAVATHELGHALRLAHPSGTRSSRYWSTRSIMYYCPTCTSFSAPQKHDKADYRAIW